MGKILNDKSQFLFKGLKDLARAQAKGARLLALGGINDFLRIHAAGNKSGALLLTMFDFTIRRGDERFTKRRWRKRRPDAIPPAGLAAHERTLRSTGRGRHRE